MRGYSYYAGWILTLAVLLQHAASASDRYVSATGNNTNAGTIGSPWRTIDYSVNRLNPGDTLYIRGGTYSESVWCSPSGTPSSRINIKAYPGETPVIDGTGIPSNYELFSINGSNVTISGIEICKANFNGLMPGWGGVGLYLNGQFNTASNVNVHDCWENGVLARGRGSIVEDSLVWGNAQANNRALGRTTYLGGGWGTGLSACRDNDSGITTNAVLRRNKVFNNWGEGISTFEARGTTIEDNTVFNNWSVNLYISDARDVLVQRNLIYTTTNSAVTNTTLTISLADEDTGKPRSANNTIINNLLYGGRFDAFYWTLVPKSGLDNVLIANNTLINSVLGTGADSTVSNTSCRIMNNIFLTDTGNPWALNATLAGLVFSNNLWSTTPPAGISGGSSDVVGNPMLTRTGSIQAGFLSTGYFTLVTNSSAVNRGLSITNVVDDCFGTTRGALPDIGAHEVNLPRCVLSIADTGSQIRVFWSGEGLLQYANDLKSNFVSIAGATNHSYVVPAPGSNRFFRVVQ